MKKFKKYILTNFLLLGFGITTSVYGAPKQGGSLTVPIITPAFTENFNPFTNGDNIKGLMFEPLLVYNSMAGKIEYRLAESFNYGSDLKSITYVLKSGLQWSDGKPLTAKDAVFSFGMAQKYPAFDAAGLFASGKVKEVVQVDERSFKVVLNDVDTTVEWSVPNYQIVPEHIWASVEDPATFENLNPVGSGPITEVEYVKPQQMKICRNPNYYLEGRPYLDCVTYRAFSDNSQIQPALMNDEIDWGSNFIADIEKTYVEENPDTHHYWYPANDAIHIYLNTKKKPFKDINFRKAFSMALDRETIVELAAYGYPTVNYFPGGLGNYFEQYMDGSVQENYAYLTEYNPEAAAELLEEAGYKDVDGDGFVENPDGSPIEFNIRVVNGWTDWVQTVQMVTEYLEEIGVRSRVEAVDWGVYDGSLKQGNYEAAINWSLLSVDPIQTYNEYFHTSRIGQIWHANHGIHAKKVDRWIDEYGQTDDEQRKQEILKELQKFTAENLPFISLFSNPTWFQFNSTRVEGWPTAENPYVHPVWYDAGKRNILFNQLYSK
jgi:peptide/nickel transport system substrate-binding protein